MAKLTIKSQEWTKLSDKPVSFAAADLRVEIDIDECGALWGRLIVGPDPVEIEMEFAK